MRGRIKKIKIGAWFITAFKFDRPEKPTAFDVRSFDPVARANFGHQFAALNRGRKKKNRFYECPVCGNEGACPNGHGEGN